MRLLDAALLLVGWWVLGALLFGAWLLSAGQYRVPPGVERDLPGQPEGAFAASAACFAVGVAAAGRRLTEQG
jgi:hypothetical protein